MEEEGSVCVKKNCQVVIGERAFEAGKGPALLVFKGRR
jgi:hypothetical protein